MSASIDKPSRWSAYLPPSFLPSLPPYLHQVLPGHAIGVQELDGSLYVPFLPEEVDEAGLEGRQILQPEGGGGGGDAGEGGREGGRERGIGWGRGEWWGKKEGLGEADTRWARIFQKNEGGREGGREGRTVGRTCAWPARPGGGGVCWCCCICPATGGRRGRG